MPNLSPHASPGQPASALTGAAAGLLIAATVAAPWVPSLTSGLPHPARTAVLGTIGLATILYTLDLLLHARTPAVPRALLLAVGWLLLQGWTMALNPQSVYDSGAAGLTPIPHWSWLPAADAAMVGLVGLGGKLGLLPLSDLFPDRPADSPFATFDYHGNAAAFLNMAVPVLIAGACADRHHPTNRRNRWFWIAGAAVCCLGVLLNHARQGPPVLTLAIVATLALLRFSRPDVSRASRRRAAAAATLLLLGGITVAAAVVASPAIRDLLRVPASLEYRLLHAQIAWRLAGDAPLLGHGPGAYKILLPITPHFIPALYSKSITTPHAPDDAIEIWDHAHNDPLQSLVEWGLLGTLAWVTLAALAAARYFTSWPRDDRPGASPTPEPPPAPSPPPIPLPHALRTGAFVGVAAVATHALFDFPLQLPGIALPAALLAGLLLAAPAPAQAARCEAS